MANPNIEPDLSPERFQAQANCTNNVILDLSSPNAFAREAALRALNTRHSITALAADVTVKLKGRRYRERLIFSLLRELDTFDAELREPQEFQILVELITAILNMHSFQSRAAGRIVARLSAWKDFSVTSFAKAQHQAMYEQRKRERWESMLVSPEELLDELLATVGNGNEHSANRSQAIIFMTYHTEKLLACDNANTRCLAAVEALAPTLRSAKEVTYCLTLYLWCLSKEAPEAKETFRKRVLAFSHSLVAAHPDPDFQQEYRDLLQGLQTM